MIDLTTPMLDINWSLLAIIFMVLVVLFVVGAMAVFYIRHWAARQASAPVQAGAGQYFQQYIPESVSTRQQSSSKQQHESIVNRVKLKSRIATGVLSMLLILAVAMGLYVNRDKLAAPIDLTEQEKAALVTIHHEWQHAYPEQLPNLQHQLSLIRKTGLVLVGNESKSESEPANQASTRHTRQPTLLHQQHKARYIWEDFAQAHQLNTVLCDWQRLAECQRMNLGWVFVVLPGQWQPHQLDKLLQNGASVILFDAPFQLDESPEFAIYDLTFKRQLQQTNNELALVGDKELSIGFDAGSIFDVKSLSSHYVVNAAAPQAIAIDSNHVAGGDISTRLYAQAFNSGRLVWMDFSPNAQDHSTELDSNRFNALIGSIFRYLNKVPYQGIATWPQGKQFAAILEEDTEDKFQNAERVRAFFAEHQYPITWYMLSNEAQLNRALTRGLAEMGEVACHGDNHQPFSLSTARGQHERMARCRKVIAGITGKQVRTFRPPEEKFNGYTLDAMVNNNITHFIAERNIDRFVPVIMQSTVNQKELVSIPRMVTDDFLLWDGMKVDAAMSRQIMEQEVRYVEKLGGIYMFSFHTQFMENDEHFSSVKYLANRLSQKNAYFQTAGSISQWWRFRARLIAGLPTKNEELGIFKPVVLKVGSNGKVAEHTYQNTAQIKAALR